MSRIPHTDLSFLVLSESGDYLAGVGKLKSGVQYLLVWDISAVSSNGDISIFAKATIHGASCGNVEGVCFVNNDRRLVTYGAYQKVGNQNGSCLKLWELQWFCKIGRVTKGGGLKTISILFNLLVQ